jgi:transcriptional regulator with XRE-family HTH domain
MYLKPSPDPKDSLWALIAFYLRFYRQKHKQTGEEVGRIIGVTKSQVSKLEHGSVRLSETEAMALDRAWNTGGLFALLVWYATLGHDPQWFAGYLDLERRAESIKIFEAHVIPGLVQTEDYAQAIIAIDFEDEKEILLARRMARQEILGLPTSPYLSMLISQNALEWPVGSPSVMRDQLTRLLELSEDPKVVVRVVPRSWDVGAYPGLNGSFRLMAGEDYGEVAYAASPYGGRLVKSPGEVRSYSIHFDQISAKALPEAPSRELLRQIREAFSE